MAAPVFVDGVTGLNAATFNALGAEVDSKLTASAAVNGKWLKGVAGAAVWSDIDTASLPANIPASKLASYPADATKALRGDGTWLSAYGHVLQRITLGASGDITFTAIPATFTHLRIAIGACRTVAATATENLVMQFNGDATAGYVWAMTVNTLGALTATSGGPSGALVAGVCTAGSGGANMWSVGDIDILGYSSVGQWHPYRSRLFSPQGVILSDAGGYWAVGSAITSIRLTGVASAFATGSSAVLYGIP